jgi:hypothetical protein
MYRKDYINWENIIMKIEFLYINTDLYIT